MKPIEAARRVRETLAEGGDARVTAWACATQFDTDTLHHIVATWLVQAARNSLRADARQSERDSIPAPLRRKRTSRTPQQRAELDAITARASANLVESLQNTVERFAEELRAEWTDELMATTFVLPNGSVTSWGDATVEQHQQRAGMFTESAAASVEAAARHRRAVTELRTLGVGTLRELVRAA